MITGPHELSDEQRVAINRALYLRELRKQFWLWRVAAVVGWCVIGGSTYVIWGAKGLAVVSLLLGIEVVLRGNRRRSELLREQQMKQMYEAANVSRAILDEAQRRGVKPSQRRGV